jgi:hypothetical protein
MATRGSGPIVGVGTTYGTRGTCLSSFGHWSSASAATRAPFTSNGWSKVASPMIGTALSGWPSTFLHVHRARLLQDFRRPIACTSRVLRNAGPGLSPFERGVFTSPPCYGRAFLANVRSIAHVSCCPDRQGRARLYGQFTNCAEPQSVARVSRCHPPPTTTASLPTSWVA